MGWSLFKELITRNTVRVFIIKDNGQIERKSLKYDKNNFVIHKEKAYIVDANAVYYEKSKPYLLYYENSPCPITFTGDVPTVRAGELESLINTKVVQEIVQGKTPAIIMLILIAFSLLLNIIIIAKLWGAFDGTS